MVMKCQKMPDGIVDAEQTKPWAMPKLDVAEKKHGFLIVPKHPRAIEQEEELRRQKEEAVNEVSEQVIDQAQLKQSYENGYNAARLDIEKNFNVKAQTLENEVTEQKEKIFNLVDALNQSIVDMQDEIEKNIKEIALRFLKVDKKSHIEYIEQNIKKYLKTHKIYKIYVSEDHLDQWVEFLPEYKDILSVKATLSDLECVINFDDFFLDGRFEALLKSSTDSEED